MTTLTEGKHAGEFIGESAMGDSYHVDEVTLVSGQNLAAGAVVGIITASGKWAAYDNAAATGVEIARGILYDAVNASGGDVTNARVVVRGPMIVNNNDLGWGTNNGAGVLAGRADLLAIGIKAL